MQKQTTGTEICYTNQEKHCSFCLSNYISPFYSLLSHSLRFPFLQIFISSFVLLFLFKLLSLPWKRALNSSLLSSHLRFLLCLAVTIYFFHSFSKGGVLSTQIPTVHINASDSSLWRHDPDFTSLSKHWIKSRSSGQSFTADLNRSKTDPIPPQHLLNQLKTNPNKVASYQTIKVTVSMLQCLYQTCSSYIRPLAKLCNQALGRIQRNWLYLKGQSILYLKPH